MSESAKYCSTEDEGGERGSFVGKLWCIECSEEQLERKGELETEEEQDKRSSGMLLAKPQKSRRFFLLFLAFGFSLSHFLK